MSEAVIVVENLSKSYLVGHKHAQQGIHKDTLRDVIQREVRDFAPKAADVMRGRQIVQGDEIEESKDGPTDGPPEPQRTDLSWAICDPRPFPT